ncbi:Hypothetical protein R9X50_00335400 [Acrodontium crateriforme]|uniref:Phospholipid/glycerol acyltransferase domain-containing protein n=1 Tax=Acrodontium crateriforme TaxID=150365 RepID=A0AAQ3R9U3_9PEZI|nr:Hypothetical protein R9X50_00335400 [Acrodontium crateriforme]
MAGHLEQFRAGVVYDIFLWIFTVVIDLFFRTIHPRSSWRIPRKGPVIFVAAPHANQFVDPLILMRTVRQDAHRRIAFLVAAKSMKRRFVGFSASLVGSVPVGRALDLKKPAKGLVFLPDPEGDATLIKGTGVNFKDGSFEPSGLIVLPTVNNSAANAEIKEVISETELRLKKAFSGDVALKQLSGEGTKFSVAPHLDQSAVYESVFQRIKEGGCIGIFPEGGSHDRTELLPLKAGLAIMALGALAENPDCGVTIVPVGMNYFHAHKFRSRAVIEFGSPIEIDPKLVDQYRDGDRRGAIGTVLEIVYDRLAAVTTLAPDYDTLMLIQAVRRLYNPKGKPMPLPMVVELNRRLIKGYTAYKDDPRIVSLRKNVLDYNSTLFRLGIRDHQISYAKFTWYQVVGKIIYRIGKLTLLSIAVLPGTVLFAPVFIAGKVISRIKSKEALAASTVKVKARDVMATWKILVSLALAPALDVFYTCVLTYWTVSNRVGGRMPEWVPLWAVFLIGIIGFPMICFAALRFGEVGMDIFKSLRPLVLSINPTSSNTLTKLRARRAWLQDQVNEIINELGPELFPDFEHERFVHEPEHNSASPTSPVSERAESPRSRMRRANTSGSAQLPRNESFNNIGSVGIFASRPTTPNRSRSRGGSDSFGGGKLQGFSPISTNNKPNMDEVSKNLHTAMRERGRRRRSEDGGWVLDPSEDGATSDGDDEPKKDI